MIFTFQGGRCIKGAAAKGARAAALLFAKRVLAKVQRFDTGHSCISGSLQKLLFRVSPDVGAPTSVTTAEEENEACVLGTVTDRNISYPDPLLKSAGMCTALCFVIDLMSHDPRLDVSCVYAPCSLCS